MDCLFQNLFLSHLYQPKTDSDCYRNPTYWSPRVNIWTDSRPDWSIGKQTKTIDEAFPYICTWFKIFRFVWILRIVLTNIIVIEDLLFTSKCACKIKVQTWSKNPKIVENVCPRSSHHWENIWTNLQSPQSNMIQECIFFCNNTL